MIRLTNWERALLAHRLEAPDCLADVFDIEDGPEDGNDYDRYPRDEVEATCDLLRAFVNGKHDLPERGFDKIKLDILTDCVEGSTWLVGYEHQTYHERRDSWTRLLDMVSKLNRIGCKIAVERLPITAP